MILGHMAPSCSNMSPQRAEPWTHFISNSMIFIKNVSWTRSWTWPKTWDLVLDLVLALVLDGVPGPGPGPGTDF